MGKRVQSDRGEIARLHITLQRRERWVCELFIGHRRSDLRQTSLVLRGSPMSPKASPRPTVAGSATPQRGLV
jgi:hypothetical protein